MLNKADRYVECSIRFFVVSACWRYSLTSVSGVAGMLYDEAPVKNLKQTYRLPGRSGPKVKAPEIREGLYEWVVDIRSALKGRLPKTMLITKAKMAGPRF